MWGVPENAEYLLGVIPDSVLLLIVSVVFGIVMYRWTKKVGNEDE